MKNLIFELAKVNRRAALIFNREIKLRIKRRELKVCSIILFPEPANLTQLIVNFSWSRTRQGYTYWSGVKDLFV